MNLSALKNEFYSFVEVVSYTLRSMDTHRILIWNHKHRKRGASNGVEAQPIHILYKHIFFA